MGFSKLLSIGLLTAFGLSAIAQVASADPAVVSINTVEASLNNSVVVSGLADYGSYTLTYNNEPASRKFKANECGFYKISSSVKYPIGTTIRASNGANSPISTVSELPLEAAPKCSSGALSGTNLTPSERLRTSDGVIYVTGVAPFATFNVDYPNVPIQRKFKANTCGFAILKQGDRTHGAGNTFTIKNSLDVVVLPSTDFADLTIKNAAPKCTSGIAYFPAGW